ncbi:hypothetical protein [Novosphingobium sp. MD-1]|uniref:hypothetical protein n=1 Tax=Novosphingobium sp. MD-1 TaxID=1630648 RepID=UPI00061BF54C|nr:hypothetical protein [Novosphingobium sp. MD-1]GAO53343.1 hypothetical protein NMD1_00349 [Novosphingobium sp. MD-1]
MTMTHRWQVWRRFSERRSSHAAGRSTAKWFGTWLDWLLVPVFLLFFTTRLVPEPVADRSLYQSIAERILAGDRLYVDVIDNKDPLFYYAIAAQRLIGPFAEYGFELACVGGAALIGAALARRFHPQSALGQRLVLMATAFMLTGPLYDRGGSIPPGIVLTLATIALATAGRGIATGVALAALLFTKLIYAPIALAFVLVHAIARSTPREPAAGFLWRCGSACAVASTVVLTALAARGELHGYLAAQQANLLYSHSNVFFAPTLLGNLWNHALTALYFGKAILALSLAMFLFLLARFLRAPADGALRPFLAGCLAIYPLSLAVIGVTAIWGPHLAVLHIFLAIGAAVAVPDLLASCGPLIALPVILGAAGVLSFGGTEIWTDDSPLDFFDRVEELDADPPEAMALHQVAGPAPVRYARLGSDNDFHHASGTRRDRLVCPRFFQYRFTDTKVLDGILACAAKADYLIVDFPEDQPLVPGTFVTPVADFAELNRRWQGFTAAAEAMLQRGFHCVSAGDTIRICRRMNRRGVTSGSGDR